MSHPQSETPIFVQIYKAKVGLKCVMSQQEIDITLEVKVSEKRESFEVTIEPGSYVSDLITDTLEQCGLADSTSPDKCQLLLVSKTTGILKQEVYKNNSYFNLILVQLFLWRMKICLIAYTRLMTTKIRYTMLSGILF